MNYAWAAPHPTSAASTVPDQIPSSPLQITEQWLTDILGSAGYPAEIRAVHVEPIGTGQMASSLRVRPDYAEQGLAPTSVVVKIASSDPNSRQAGARGAYLKEVRFYQELAHTLPVATPRAFWSAIDLDSNEFAIVLEDMSMAKQGDQILGCSVERVEVAARNIAGLHAPHWCDEDLFEIDWLTVPRSERDSAAAEAKAIVGMVMPGFIARYAGRLTDDHIELLTWFTSNVDSWLLDDAGRFALVHGDHRLDNLLFNQADPDRPVTVVDWQTIAVRNPVADISYLLGTSVEPGVRRSIEQSVVQTYHQQLCGLGVRDYDESACFDDYRRQTPHALLLTVLGSMLTVQTNRGDDMFMAMLSRSAQQIADLDVR